MSRLAVQRQRQAHFLQHVAVVVNPGLVNAKRNWHPAAQEADKVRNSTLEPEVGRAVVAKAGAAFRHKRDVISGHPDTMADRELRSEQAETVYVRNCRAARSAGRG